MTGKPQPFPIARELLSAEYERLLRGHFGDGRASACPQCQRAEAIRGELGPLSATCAYDGEPMNTMVRGHHHTENGKDVTR